MRVNRDSRSFAFLEYKSGPWYGCKYQLWHLQTRVDWTHFIELAANSQPRQKANIDGKRIKTDEVAPPHSAED